MNEPEGEPEAVRLREAEASGPRASPAARRGCPCAIGALAQRSHLRCYAVARCVGAEHLEGQVLALPWEEVLGLLPGCRLRRGRTYIRGFDTPAEARAWLAAEASGPRAPLAARRGFPRASGAPAQRSHLRCYAVARGVGAEHLEGQVLALPWEEVLGLLPGRQLRCGRTYIRGFDTPAEARAWLAAERPCQAAWPSPAPDVLVPAAASTRPARQTALAAQPAPTEAEDTELAPPPYSGARGLEPPAALPAPLWWQQKEHTASKEVSMGLPQPEQSLQDTAAGVPAEVWPLLGPPWATPPSQVSAAPQPASGTRRGDTRQPARWNRRGGRR